MGFILLTIFLDVLGFGLLIPVGPRLVMELQSGGAVDAMQISAAEAAAAPIVGGLSATYAAMLFLFAPVLGALSDRFGRRPVLLVALLGSGIDYFAMAMAPSVAWLFVTRVLNGISGATMTVANAYIADVTPPEKRAAAFGMVGAAFGLGFIFGPIIGGSLGEVNIRLPFYAAGAITLLNWGYGMMVVPESLKREHRHAFTVRRGNPFGVFAALGRYPLVLGLAAALFLTNLAQFGLHTTWVLYTEHRYQWGSFQVGLSLAIAGLATAVVQAGLARKIIPWLGERRSVLVGLMVATMGYAAYGAATQGWMVYVIIAVAALSGIGVPAAQAIITKSVAPTEQGATQGAIQGLQSMAAIVGPLLATNVFAYFISERAPAYVPGASFYLGAGLAAMGAAVAGTVLRRTAGGPDKAVGTEALTPNEGSVESGS